MLTYSRTFSSKDPVTSRFACGLKLAHMTYELWPSSFNTDVSASTSHKRTVLSSDAEAKNRPSTDQATSLNPSVCPFRVAFDSPLVASHILKVASAASPCHYIQKREKFSFKHDSEIFLKRKSILARKTCDLLNLQAVARVWPSGECFTELTARVWPSSTLAHVKSKLVDEGSSLGDEGDNVTTMLLKFIPFKLMLYCRILEASTRSC
jgi:hypothetical protein